MVGIGTALGVASLGASLLGGKKGEKAAASGFAALPKEVQDAWLKTYLPSVLSLFNRPYTPLPMARVDVNSADPFRSQGLIDLQNYSDSVGGIFNTPSMAEALPKTAIPASGAGGNEGAAALSAISALFGPNYVRGFLQSQQGG